MAQNFSELAILEGNDNCIPVRLNGIVVDVPQHYFNTNLYNIKDVLDHENQNLLNGIEEHFNREGLMVGEDGFVYASIDPDNQTLSGDDYEPIGLLHGEELELAGFKFKMPRMPGKRGGGKGRLVRTRSGTLNAAGNLATRGFRTFHPIGMMGRQGLIGRNLRNVKNPFKGLGKIKIGNPFKKLGKIKNPFKGGKGKGGGMMDALTQFQEMQAQQAEELPQEEIVEEESSDKYIDESQSDNYSQEDTSDSSQTDYPEDPQEDTSNNSQTDSDSLEVGNDLAFSAVNTALSFVPGGNIASGLLSQGKVAYDQQRQKKQAVSQQRVAMLQNLIRQNPRKKVVVVKKPQAPQLVRKPAPAVRQNFASTPVVRNNTTPTDFQPTPTETKKDNSMLMWGIAGLAAVGLAMSSGKE